MKLTLERAEEILKKHTTEEHLFTHALAVSSAMGAMAEHFGEDPEYWRAIGYLHDVDYEKFPEEHCKHVRELLAPEGVEEEDIRAIISHGYGLCTEEVKPETNLEKEPVCSGRAHRHSHGLRPHAAYRYNGSGGQQP